METNGSTTTISDSQSFASESQCQRTATIFPLEQSPARAVQVEFYEAVRRASERPRFTTAVRGARAGELEGEEGRGVFQFAPLLRDLSSRIDIQHSPFPTFWGSSLVHQSDIMGGREPTARSSRLPFVLSRSRLLSSFKGPRQPKEHTASQTPTFLLTYEYSKLYGRRGVILWRIQ